jgi:poly-gamma-glutamate synthesis protein (capsule biosynthesis protein)
MKKYIKLTFTGDIMCQREQNLAALARHGRYDYRDTFVKVADLFKESDYVIGNLETPIGGEQLQYSDEKSRFNTPESFLDALCTLGINFLSIANNHCLDRGIVGLNNTLAHLNARGLESTGAYAHEEESNQVFVKTIDGARFAFLSFTYGTNSEHYGEPLPSGETWRVDLLKKQGVRTPTSRISPSLKSVITAALPQNARQALLALMGKKSAQPEYVSDNVHPNAIEDSEDTPFLDRARRKIERAKSTADFVVVLPHVGGQYNPAPGLYHRWLMRLLAESGVDLLVANHAHTPLRLERFPHNVLGAYSLGNFCFTPIPGWYLANALAEYSVLLHIYLSTSQLKIEKVTFNVLKCVVEPDGFSTVQQVFDLITNEKNAILRERLIVENEAVVNRFSGSSDTVLPQREYYLSI